MRALRIGVAMAMTAGVAACGPKPAPTPRPPVEAPVSDALDLRYTAGSLVHDVELELTETRVGRYVEAKVRLTAGLALVLTGDVLRAEWALQTVEPLELTGTVAPDEHHKARGLLLTRGKGAAIGDVRGVVDTDATDADPINAARLAALDVKAPPAGVLLLEVLAEQLRLPRLPAGPLREGEQVELEEESETVVVDGGTEITLPTTTVHRITLRGIDEHEGTRLAELAFEVVSVAEPAGDAGESARVEIRSEGTLSFDVAAGVPVSLDLSRTETFQLGEVTGERSLALRSRYRSP